MFLKIIVFSMAILFCANIGNEILKELRLELIRNQPTILSSEQMLELNNLCMFKSKQKWKLIYKATRDGFNVGDFHSKCDNLENSLVIIE